MSILDEVRASLKWIERMHPVGRIQTGSVTHGGPPQYGEGCLDHGARCPWLAEAKLLRKVLTLQNAYPSGYADGYARALAGDPPYVEPSAIEDLPKLEYGWAGDAQADTFYDSLAEAEEFIGAPKKFVRTQAGPWQEADHG